jgi:hypothetical protein
MSYACTTLQPKKEKTKGHFRASDPEMVLVLPGLEMK